MVLCVRPVGLAWTPPKGVQLFGVSSRGMWTRSRCPRSASSAISRCTAMWEQQTLTIAVHVRMNVAKEPMTEYGSDGWVCFRFKKIEKRRHRIAHGFPAWWHITGCAQKHEVVAISSKSARRDDACGDGGLKQLAIPASMSGSSERTRVGAGCIADRSGAIALYAAGTGGRRRSKSGTRRNSSRTRHNR
jgi:hypothetical protein